MNFLSQSKYYYRKLINEIWFHYNGHLLSSKNNIKHNPFFIVGSGRCGTTLLRVLIEKDRKICIPPESGWSFEKSVQFFLRKPNLSNGDWNRTVNRIFDIYESDQNWKYWNINLRENARKINEIKKEQRSFQTIIQYIYQSYSEITKPEVSLWGDKNPYMVFALKYILKTFPGARIINLIRDGRDVVASWKSTGLKYSNLGDICNRWNWSIKEAEKYKKKFPDQIIFIKYEDLVERTSITLDKIFNHLDICYDPVTDLRNSSIREDLNQPHLKKSKNEITGDNIGNWKNILSEKEVILIKPKISQFLEKYNYLSPDK